MSFDPAVVQLEDGDPGSLGLNAALGDFLSSVFTAQNTLNNGLGTVDVALTQLNVEPRSGDGTLFSLTLSAIGAGDAAFQFDEVLFADVNALEIPLVTVEPEILVVDGTATATHTSQPQATATSTRTLTRTPTRTSTSVATSTATSTATTQGEPSPTGSASVTPSLTRSLTPTHTNTPTPSATATRTPPSQGPFFYLLPASRNVDVGQSFDVVIHAFSNGEAISGVEVRLAWNPNLLEVTQITPGNTFQGYQTYTPLYEINNGSGNLYYAHSMIEPEVCVEGEWVVATVTFRALDYGVSAIAFTQDTLMACMGLDIVPGWANAQVFVGTTATPTLTPSVTETPTGSVTPPPTPCPIVCRELLVNGGFEMGASGWTLTGLAEISPYKPHLGALSAWLGGYDLAQDRIYQDLTLPAEVMTATLTYWWHGETLEEQHPFDYLYVELVHNGVTTTVATYSDADDLNVWNEGTPVDLSSYAGETIRIVFRVVTDGKLYSSFFVDDVSLEICLRDCPPEAGGLYMPLVLKDYQVPVAP
jgi:hypothetical protein